MKYWLIIFSVSAYLEAMPITHLEKSGEGEMTYLFWNLYKAELYVSPTNNNSENVGETALKITYQKSISSKALIEATKDQWEHLNYPPKEIDRWINALSRLLPKVSPKDTLTILVDSNKISYLYLNLTEIGVIKDPGFGPAFLSIWLSKETSEPKLRKKLLGISS